MSTKRVRTKGAGFTNSSIGTTEPQDDVRISKTDIQAFAYNGSPVEQRITIGYRPAGASRPTMVAEDTFSATKADYYREGSYYYWTEGAAERLQEQFVSLAKQLVAKASGGVETKYPNDLTVIPQGYESEICRDIVTPGFKTRVKRGEIINNPYFKESLKGIFNVSGENPSMLKMVGDPWLTCNKPRRQRNPSGLRISYNMKAVWNTVDSSLDPEDFTVLIQTVSDPSLPSVRQTALNSAFGNKTDADFDLSVFIAERQSTISLVANRMRQLASIIADLKNGSWRKWAPRAWKKYSKNGRISSSAIADGLSDAWLEMRYGWCPLIMDVNGLIKTLKKGEMTPRQTFRGYEAIEGTENVSFALPSGATFTGSKSEISSARAGILTSVDVHAALADRWGLATWANTAWELVPFSFVIDWFIDIGALLKASTTFMYKDLAVWTTEKTSTILTGNIDTGSSMIPVQIERTMTDRKPGGTPQYFSFDINLNLTRLTDAAALLYKLR